MCPAAGTAQLCYRRGKRSNTPKELPTGTCVTPALETQGTAGITGVVTLLWLGKGSHTKIFSRGWQHSLPGVNPRHTTGRPLLLHALHPLPWPRNDGMMPAACQQQDRQPQNPDRAFHLLLGAALPPPQTLQLLRQKVPTRNSVHGNELCTLPTAFSRRGGGKKSLIQDTKKICIKQLCSVNETCILKRWRTQPIITWGSAWPFNWFTDPPSENAGVHLVKRMCEINNQGKAKIKMKNEGNVNNKNIQAQKIPGEAVT